MRVRDGGVLMPLFGLTSEDGLTEGQGLLSGAILDLLVEES